LVFSRRLLDFKDHWSRSIDYENQYVPECHDQWFPGLATGFGRVAYISEPLVQYRQHGQNTTMWKPPPASIYA
jgi:hypothetical protein